MAPASITYLATRRPRGPHVADVINTAVVRVPLWFTAAQARGVAVLKKVEHLLVEDRGRVAGSVSASALRGAPATDPVARWMGRSEAHLDPELPLAEAEKLIRREGVGCLPVVRGGLLIGIVCLDDVAGDVAHAA